MHDVQITSLREQREQVAHELEPSSRRSDRIDWYLSFSNAAGTSFLFAVIYLFYILSGQAPIASAAPHIQLARWPTAVSMRAPFSLRNPRAIIGRFYLTPTCPVFDFFASIYLTSLSHVRLY